MIEIQYTGEALWERIERAVEKVKDRLRRVTETLNAAEIPYAVIGGNAVQHWGAQVDESAVRNTQDVDILLNESDLERDTTVLEPVALFLVAAPTTTCFWTDHRPRLATRSTSSSPARRSVRNTPNPYRPSNSSTGWERPRHCRSRN